MSIDPVTGILTLIDTGYRETTIEFSVIVTNKGADAVTTTTIEGFTVGVRREEARNYEAYTYMSYERMREKIN